MAKPEWGTKRVCLSCASKFYDFSRAPILCPSCGAVFDIEVATRVRRSRPAPRVEPDDTGPIAADPELASDDVATVEEPEEDEEDEVEVEVEPVAVEDDVDEDDEDEVPIIEDTADLGDDDEVADVIEEDLDEDSDASR